MVGLHAADDDGLVHLRADADRDLRDVEIKRRAPGDRELLAVVQELKVAGELEDTADGEVAVEVDADRVRRERDRAERFGRAERVDPQTSRGIQVDDRADAHMGCHLQQAGHVDGRDDGDRPGSVESRRDQDASVDADARDRAELHVAVQLEHELRGKGRGVHLQGEPRGAINIQEWRAAAGSGHEDVPEALDHDIATDSRVGRAIGAVGDERGVAGNHDRGVAGAAPDEPARQRGGECSAESPCDITRHGVGDVHLGAVEIELQRGTDAEVLHLRAGVLDAQFEPGRNVAVGHDLEQTDDVGGEAREGRAGDGNGHGADDEDGDADVLAGLDAERAGDLRVEERASDRGIKRQRGVGEDRERATLDDDHLGGRALAERDGLVRVRGVEFDLGVQRAPDPGECEGRDGAGVGHEVGRAVEIAGEQNGNGADVDGGEVHDELAAGLGDVRGGDDALGGEPEIKAEAQPAVGKLKIDESRVIRARRGGLAEIDFLIAQRAGKRRGIGRDQTRGVEHRKPLSARALEPDAEGVAVGRGRERERDNTVCGEERDRGGGGLGGDVGRVGKLHEVGQKENLDVAGEILEGDIGLRVHLQSRSGLRPDAERADEHETHTRQPALLGLRERLGHALRTNVEDHDRVRVQTPDVAPAGGTEREARVNAQERGVVRHAHGLAAALDNQHLRRAGGRALGGQGVRDHAVVDGPRAAREALDGGPGSDGFALGRERADNRRGQHDGRAARGEVRDGGTVDAEVDLRRRELAVDIFLDDVFAAGLEQPLLAGNQPDDEAHVRGIGDVDSGVEELGAQTQGQVQPGVHLIVQRGGPVLRNRHTRGLNLKDLGLHTAGLVDDQFAERRLPLRIGQLVRRVEDWGAETDWIINARELRCVEGNTAAEPGEREARRSQRDVHIRTRIRLQEAALREAEHELDAPAVLERYIGAPAEVQNGVVHHAVVGRDDRLIGTVELHQPDDDQPVKLHAAQRAVQRAADALETDDRELVQGHLRGIDRQATHVDGRGQRADREAQTRVDREHELGRMRVEVGPFERDRRGEADGAGAGRARGNRLASARAAGAREQPGDIGDIQRERDGEPGAGNKGAVPHDVEVGGGSHERERAAAVVEERIAKRQRCTDRVHAQQHLARASRERKVDAAAGDGDEAADVAGDGGRDQVKLAGDVVRERQSDYQAGRAGLETAGGRAKLDFLKPEPHRAGRGTGDHARRVN